MQLCFLCKNLLLRFAWLELDALRAVCYICLYHFGINFCVTPNKFVSRLSVYYFLSLYCYFCHLFSIHSISWHYYWFFYLVFDLFVYYLSTFFSHLSQKFIVPPLFCYHFQVIIVASFFRSISLFFLALIFEPLNICCFLFSFWYTFGKIENKRANRVQCLLLLLVIVVVAFQIVT